MSADQLIAEFRKLSPEQQQQVVEAIVVEDDSWIPESFRQGMEDLNKGRSVSLEKALLEKPPQVD